VSDLVYCINCKTSREDPDDPCLNCHARATCKDLDNLTEEEKEAVFDDWLRSQDEDMTELCYPQDTND